MEAAWYVEGGWESSKGKSKFSAGPPFGLNPPVLLASVSSWARTLLQSRGIRVRTTPQVERAEDDGWADAYALDTQNRFPEQFYRDEWNEVVQAQGILDEASYLRARRAGRGTRLSREQRKQVWEVL